MFLFICFNKFIQAPHLIQSFTKHDVENKNQMFIFFQFSRFAEA